MKVPKQDDAVPPMNDTLPDIGDGADPIMGDEPEGMPDGDNEPPMGDGTDDKNGEDSDQQELDDIFSNASLEDKNAILKYAKSQTEKDDDSSDSNDDEMSQENDMPMESYRMVKKQFIDEIVNSLTNDFDLNSREGNKDTKRGEKSITNKRIGRKNPFISGR